MGFLGMFLNKKDADAISSDLHQQSMQTIHESNLRLERMREKSKRHTEMLLAIKIQELNDRIAWLENEVALRDARIEAHMKMSDVLLDLDDPKLRKSYFNKYWQFENQALDNLLASGELTVDPRKDKNWRERRSYLPPKQTIGKREPELA